MSLEATIRTGLFCAAITSAIPRRVARVRRNRLVPSAIGTNFSFGWRKLQEGQLHFGGVLVAVSRLSLPPAAGSAALERRRTQLSMGTRPRGVSHAPSLMIASARPTPVWLGHSTRQRLGISIRRRQLRPRDRNTYNRHAERCSPQRELAFASQSGTKQSGINRCALPRADHLHRRDRSAQRPRDGEQLLAVIGSPVGKIMLRAVAVIAQGTKQGCAFFQSQGLGAGRGFHSGLGQGSAQTSLGIV